VTLSLRDRGIGAVLLDIEGTTTPIAFVHDVLFPYARAHIEEFLQDPRHTADVGEVAHRLAGEHARDERQGERPPAWPADPAADPRPAVAAYARWLMDRDRKSPGLKLLQGLIWERGYQAGLLRGLVFEDVPVALRRWRDAGVAVAIYSSGSELAQRRLFESTPFGDLTPLLAGFFDTNVGPKTAPESYARIAERLSRPPGAIAFVSDSAAELAAAARAGLHPVLSVRPGNPPQDQDGWDVVQTLDEIVV
jgi:enolase-phosphatase E1